MKAKTQRGNHAKKLFNSIRKWALRTRVQRQMVRDLYRQARQSGCSSVTDRQVGRMSIVEVVYEEQPRR